MCNRYGYQHPLNALPDEFSEIGPMRWDGLEPNAPLDQIRPTDRALIIRPTEGGLELAMVRWGLVPWFHKGPLKDFKGLNTNARAETVSTPPSFKGPYAPPVPGARDPVFRVDDRSGQPQGPKAHVAVHRPRPDHVRAGWPVGTRPAARRLD